MKENQHNYHDTLDWRPKRLTLGDPLDIPRATCAVVTYIEYIVPSIPKVNSLRIRLNILQTDLFSTYLRNASYIYTTLKILQITTIHTFTSSTCADGGDARSTTIILTLCISFPNVRNLAKQAPSKSSIHFSPVPAGPAFDTLHTRAACAF